MAVFITLLFRCLSDAWRPMATSVGVSTATKHVEGVKFLFKGISGGALEGG
jgi:hypothetical protein